MNIDKKALWIEYKEKNLSAAREELIVQYAHLVKYVAGRLAITLSSVVEVDELISYGVEGLIDAIEKFDHQRNIKFETYAITRIRGSMIDGLRSMDWVPVSVRQKGKELEKTFAKLETELGRSATDAEAAAAMGLNLRDYNNLLKDVSCSSMISLDDFIPGENMAERKKRIVDVLEDHNAADALKLVGDKETKDLLVASIGKLPEKEKKVIYLYYYEGLTLKEIGAVLELSESRISQLHTKAILRMRGSLSKKKDMLCKS
jgi:RNA polymerase sigma factor for flagellar operon FliA